MNQIQQGDVLLKRVDALPKGAKKKSNDSRGVVLAEGEVTGHFHGIASRNARLLEHDGKTFLHATRSVKLSHQEHNTITIAPGIYEVGRVQEWDYLAQMSRNVAD